ncbi:DUF1735 domain-containing protein [Niabella soli]|uniref:BT-3987-like N-terminal domain-containing protein n=1 Tax=Niabella soli DSM 19437 TaxID=929713 RepID=W0F810_9BACT|nr:DUF1735 domain-containing protein [Niabella soli]AHF17599.1 hypothetical protein NIASO_10650 [Niabella soli DSM 19437]
MKERIGNIDTGNGNTTNLVEFKNTGNNMAQPSSKYPSYNKDLGVAKVGDKFAMNINVGYSGTEAAAPEDITVNLELDQAALQLYNDQNGAEFEVPPTSVYAFPATAVIKKGSNQATVQLAITISADFDYNKTYAIPLKIKSTSPAKTISQNFGSALYSFLVRNKYDGRYTLTGHHNRAPYDFPYETEIHLMTTGASSVAFYWPDAESYGHPIGVGPDNDLSWYGSAISPVIVFDPATDKITSAYNIGGATVISLYTGAGALSNLQDQSTKTIYVSWMYGGNPQRAFFDTLKYIGPR